MPEADFCPRVVAESGEILSNAPVNCEYRHLVVACGPIGAAAAPGQFFQLLCPAPAGRLRSFAGR